jgi:hypothetical protein
MENTIFHFSGEPGSQGRLADCLQGQFTFQAVSVEVHGVTAIAVEGQVCINFRHKG